MSRASAPDRALLAGARRRLTVLSAAAVTAALLLVGVLVLVVESRGEQAAAVSQLAAACAAADRGAGVPAGVWLSVRRPDGGISRDPAAPAGLPDGDSLRRAAGGGVQQGTIELAGTAYLVRSERRGDRTVQAAMSVVDRDDDLRRLLGSVAVAELAGLAASVLIGAGLARRSLRPLADALDRQRRFVADASHELRAPLTQLHTRAQLLQRDLSAAGPDVRRETRRLVEDSRRLGEVISDLLTSAELEHEPRRYGTVDLAALTAGVVDGLRVCAEAGGIELLLRDSGPVPVRGSAPALRRVAAALIDNAIGHSPPHSVVEVDVGRDGAGRHGRPGPVRLVVRDRGAGFDPADADRIFDRFASGELGQGRRYGLGLALVREVVTAHGGTVEATGRPGHGSTFTVRLPGDPSDC